MEHINNDEIIKKISKELHDIFHGDASYLLEDKEFYDLVLNSRLKKYGITVKLKVSSLSSDLTIVDKLKSWLTGKNLISKMTLEEAKEFESMNEAFSHIYNNRKQYMWYKMLSSAKKRVFRDTAYQIKKESIGVSRERLINLLNDYFTIEEKFLIKPKSESPE